MKKKEIGTKNMANKKQYPNQLFVLRENEGTQDEFLNTSENPETLAEIGEKRRVARYVLHETVHIDAVVKVSGNHAVDLYKK